MTRRSLRSSLVGLTALTAITLAACGSDDDSSSATTPTDAGLVVEAGPGIKFGQNEYTATAGDVKVAYVNKDTQRHTLVVVDADKKTIGSEMEVGKSGDVDTRDYTLAAGTYSLLCLVPGHEAMKATLTVS